MSAMLLHSALLSAYEFYTRLPTRLKTFLLRPIYRKFQHIWPSPYAHAQRPAWQAEKTEAVDAYAEGENP